MPHAPGRARRAIRITIAAAIVVGLSLAFALRGLNAHAAIGAAIAAFLIIAALHWALRQEDNR